MEAEIEMEPHLEGVRPPEGYLEKPFDVDALLEKVRRLLTDGERN